MIRNASIFIATACALLVARPARACQNLTATFPNGSTSTELGPGSATAYVAQSLSASNSAKARATSSILRPSNFSMNVQFFVNSAYAEVLTPPLGGYGDATVTVTASLLDTFGNVLCTDSKQVVSEQASWPGQSELFDTGIGMGCFAQGAGSPDGVYQVLVAVSAFAGAYGASEVIASGDVSASSVLVKVC